VRTRESLDDDFRLVRLRPLAFDELACYLFSRLWITQENTVSYTDNVTFETRTPFMHGRKKGEMGIFFGRLRNTGAMDSSNILFDFCVLSLGQKRLTRYSTDPYRLRFIRFWVCGPVLLSMAPCGLKLLALLSNTVNFYSISHSAKIAHRVLGLIGIHYCTFIGRRRHPSCLRRI
jgi:hypothetical protein